MSLTNQKYNRSARALLSWTESEESQPRMLSEYCSMGWGVRLSSYAFAQWPAIMLCPLLEQGNTVPQNKAVSGNAAAVRNGRDI